MVLDVVVCVISKISGQFEWASMAKNYVLFKNGPAKSMCTLCHGFEGHDQGCNGADGGACLVDRHAWNSATYAQIDYSSNTEQLIRARFSAYIGAPQKVPWVTPSPDPISWSSSSSTKIQYRRGDKIDPCRTPCVMANFQETLEDRRQ